jgi:hypothetical protein
MVSSTRSVRPSNHEGVLTGPSTSHSRASEARPENLWAMRAIAGPRSRGPKILGSSPRMTRGWACVETHQACVAL